MIKAYKEYWQNITNMEGSATRSQYWWPQVVNYFVMGIYSSIVGIQNYVEFTTRDRYVVLEWNMVTIGFVLLGMLIWLANFTVRARRLHDRDHSNWWIAWYLLPLLGALIIFFEMISPGRYSFNKRWPINQSDF
ncbi:DUF805 domain-containing protein [Enterococcus sp. LJL120]